MLILRPAAKAFSFLLNKRVKYLGIDFGVRKVGLAIGDDEMGIAFPFGVEVPQLVHYFQFLEPGNDRSMLFYRELHEGKAMLSR